jgi:hypothetical protein
MFLMLARQRYTFKEGKSLASKVASTNHKHQTL